MIRLKRSELSVPATQQHMIEKAVASSADVAFLDLEDSVPPDLKRESRGSVVHALRELDWRGKPPGCRINAVDTAFFYRDVVEIVEAAGDALALLIVPKVERPEDLILLDTLLHGIELNIGLPPGRIHIEAQIESARGLLHAERIAIATPRLEALIFGPGDFASNMHMPARSIGARDEWDEHYPGHRFHHAMSTIVVAARAAGIQVIDGPLADYRDLDAFRTACMIARGLGYDGKWCIHPAQVPIANEVFSPAKQEIAWAKQVVSAYRESTRQGLGATSVENTMIDVASIRMAETTLELARQAGVLDEHNLPK
ncbi:MAG: CoA ester lyase [Chloroflexota bacterium]